MTAVNAVRMPIAAKVLRLVQNATRSLSLAGSIYTSDAVMVHRRNDWTRRDVAEMIQASSSC